MMEKLKKKLEDIDLSFSKNISLEADSLTECGLKDITLRDYQLDGVRWLVERYHRGHGCILGDEMGLGKTCQTISYLVHLHGSSISKGPHLIVSPLSVLKNWEGEIARFAPNLKAVSYVGSKDVREELRDDIRKMRKKNEINAIITTYEICLKDERFLGRFQWHTLVVDEAHRLKNAESLLYQVLSGFDIQHTILLTGTPVQNNLQELCALLSFVAPSVFKEKYTEAIVERYSKVVINNENFATELHSILKPFLLRRIKDEVVFDLPNKTEMVMYHGMSKLQKKYYKAILTKDIEAFENPNQASRTRLMNILIQLRKCVNHPYLFDGVEPEPFELGEHLVEASGKLVLIDQLLAHLRPRGHKVLMFSQMTRMLDILQDYLGYRGYTYERLDGSVRGEERYLAVQNFNDDEGTFIFLLSTKAGGQGLNLVGADTVIFVDSDFNPQNDLQAAARAHRIGQTRPVKVVRLIGRSTVEEIILERAESKLKLTNTVIEGGQFSSTSVADRDKLVADSNTKLQDILKFGVDKLFESEDSSIEDVDFVAMLGPSVDGEWQLEETTKEAQATLAESADSAYQSVGESMYVYEGTDYSKETSAEDEKTFQKLLEAEKALIVEETGAEGRALRRHKTIDVDRYMPELPARKPRKKLSPEELEERKKKRAEAAALRAQKAEEEKLRRREALWKKHRYTSLNIEVPSEGEEEEEDEERQEEQRKDITYVVGDVTQPKVDAKENAIIVHCVDDSGRWGSGGLFSAISSRSEIPDNQYSLAGDMNDLNLGDGHFIELDGREKEDSSHYVMLIVAQHRDKRNNLSGIKLSALSTGLERLRLAAKQKSASVHLPRIGYNTPGFNWYGTERLIRKHLASRGIDTYIYYFSRRASLKRKDTSFHAGKPGKSRKKSTESEKTDSDDDTIASKDTVPMDDDDEPKPSTSGTTFNSTTADDSGFMEGCCIHLHGLSAEDRKKYTHLIVKHDGDIHKTVEDSTTHIVTTPDLPAKQALTEYVEGFEEAIVVSTEWMDECFKQLKKLPVSPYALSVD